MGHWLVLLVLPLFVFFFRKGLVYCLPLVFLAPLDSQAASLWDKLWKTPDQRATELVEQENYTNAAQTFKRQDWAAVADYKNGDYQSAVQKLEKMDDAESLYNKANALALSGKLKEAIDAYEEVLEKQSNHEDAAYNKQLIEELLKQQDQNQDKSKQNSDKQDSDQQQSEQGDSEQQNSEQKNSEQQQSNDQQTSEDQQQNQQENQSQDNSQQNSSEQKPAKEQQEREQQAQTQQQEDEQEKGSQEQAQQQQSSTEEQQDNSDEESDETAQAAIDQSSEPLKDSSEQWLRSIEDDPSGLLRRKFEYQNWLRQQQGQSQSAPSGDERY